MANEGSKVVYTASDIANYFLFKYGKDGEITPMKLIKLVYISYGWYLGIFGTRLINEQPEAWKYGPVIPSLYHSFKSYRDSVITYQPAKPNIEDSVQKFLDKIWQVYGQYTGVELSTMTHQSDSPWSKVWNTSRSIKSNEISDYLIEEYYAKMVET